MARKDAIAPPPPTPPPAGDGSSWVADSKSKAGCERCGEPMNLESHMTCCPACGCPASGETTEAVVE